MGTGGTDTRAKILLAAILVGVAAIVAFAIANPSGVKDADASSKAESSTASSEKKSSGVYEDTGNGQKKVISPATLDSTIRYQGLEFSINSKWRLVGTVGPTEDNTKGWVSYFIGDEAPVAILSVEFSTEGRAVYPNERLSSSSFQYRVIAQRQVHQFDKTYDAWIVESLPHSSGTYYLICMMNDPENGHGFEISISLPRDNYELGSVRDLMSSIISSMSYNSDETEYGDEKSFMKLDTSTPPSSTTTTTPKAPEPTVSQQNALKRAKSYLNSNSYSHDGLIKQLEYEGFSNEDATYGADNCGADWMKQAEAKAKRYNDLIGYSRSGLIDQLMYDGFTEEEAEHGADSVGL